MKTTPLSLLAGALSVLVAACTTTTDITTRGQLEKWAGRGTLLILTHDSILYRISISGMNDSAIVGVGTSERGESMVPFRGNVPLSQIKYAQVRRLDQFHTLLAIGAVGGMGAYLLSSLGSQEGGSARVDVQYIQPNGGGGGGGGGGGSCPFLYAWNGRDFILQGEAFSVAWGSALEYATTHMLPDLVEEEGTLKIRVSNIRPETHYVNSVRLLAVRAGQGEEILPDPEGRFWPVRDVEGPVKAVDHSDKDVRALLASEDDVRWVSDFAPAETGGGFEDTLDLAFTRRHHEKCATLVLRAINTRISAAVFAHVGRLLGDQAVRFIDHIEHDPRFAAALRKWIDAASLGVEIWNGSSWEQSGKILPEANEMSFTKVLRISVPAGTGDEVRIRLRALCDVWEIDRVGLDCSAVIPVPAIDGLLTAAVDDGGGDVSRLITRDDSVYSVILPPDGMTLRYAVPPSGPGQGWKYALRIGGYLHEWLPDDGSGSGLLSALSGEGRVEVLRRLMTNRELLLPPIYASWRKEGRER